MSITLDDVLAAAVSIQRGNRGGGRKPAARCVNGHDKAVHGQQQWKDLPDGRRVKNGTRCRECTRTQQRVAWKAGRS